MPFRAVLFDWDGTLVRNDAPRWTAGSVTDYVRRELGIAARDDDFFGAFRAVLPRYEPGTTQSVSAIGDLLQAAFARLNWPASSVDVDACTRLFFDEVHAGLHVFDDARALLASLKFRGYRMGVVTNAIFPGALFAARAAGLGLAGYFDAVVSSADVGAGKPNPAIYRRALEHLGVDASETLFVGDRVDTDVAGAIGVGMPAVLIARGSQKPQPEGFTVVERLSALNDLLGENPV